MKLRVFLPAGDRPDPGTPFTWKIFDGRHAPMRGDTTPVDEIPRVADCELIIPAERVLFARLKLPRVNPATIRELLPYAVEDRLLADPTHIHAVAGARNSHGETVVAVVDRDWLQAMLDALARAGLRPTSAWSESALLAGGHRDWQLVWGPRRGMLVDDEGIAATFDRAPGVPLALRLAVDEATTRGDRPEKVRVHTAEDEPLPDLEAFSRESGVAFEPGTRWDILAGGQPAAGSINLLQGDFSPRSGRGTWNIPRAAVWLAAAIVLLQVGFTAWDAWRLQRERSALEARREEIFRAAFPEARVVVDPELQMARNLAQLQRDRGLAAGDEFLAALTRVARERAGAAKAVEYANGKVIVR